MPESDSVLVEYYEGLRSIALGATAQMLVNRGLALLMHKGMATWIQSWSRLCNKKRQQDITSKSEQSTWSNLGVVPMLAEMTLSAAKAVSR